MKIRVDNRVRILLSELTEEQQKQLQAMFEHTNPEYGRLVAMGVKRGLPAKYDRSWRIEGGGYESELTFPLGGFDRVRDELGAVQVEEHFTRGDEALSGLIPDHRRELYPFQEDAVDLAIAAKHGIVRMPQGSGKTTIGMAIASRLNLATLVIVWTTDLLEQWIERCVEELGMQAKEVGIIKGAKRKLGSITIAMQQTLAGGVSREYADTFGVVILDEAQRAAAATYIEVIDEFRAEYRIGITADERRSDRKEYLIHDYFGAVAAEAKKRELERDGFIVPVEIRVIESAFGCEWYEALCAKEREARTRIDDSKAAKKRWQRLLKAITLRHNDLVDEMVSDHPRNELVMAVVELAMESELQVLALSHRKDHCRLIDQVAAARGYAGGTLIGGPDFAVERRRAKKALKEGSIRFAVGTYQAVGTGTDIPKVARGVFATPSANGTNGRSQWGQFTGRYNRRGKKDACVYYIWDRRLYGSKPLANICKWSKQVWVMLPEGESIEVESSATMVDRGIVWVRGREYLKEVQREEQERSGAGDGDELDGFFERGSNG